uniref:Uncharacterized protein n=1 Tax=Cyclopterus lumpus TaxID=8103 RepID=A0A8C2WVT9_CYCLU
MGKPCLSLPPTDTKHDQVKRSRYLPLISQRVSGHLRGHTLLIESSQLPVAGNEMFRKHRTFILLNRPNNGPPRKRDRISASWSHIGLKCSRDN